MKNIKVPVPASNVITTGSLSTINYSYLHDLDQYILELFPIYTEKLFKNIILIF